MKTRITSILLTTLLIVVITSESQGQGTAFTYQGRLNDGAAPANGSYDLKFTLFNPATALSALDQPRTNSAVTVSNGLFTVLLDFGPDAFAGSPTAQLEIAVRRLGGGSFTTLSPRQPITPTPYAITALNALNVPGVSGNALHAADGNPQNAVFVDNNGKVGIGTVSPASRFHVIASATDIPASPRLESSGANGFGAGWDFYHGVSGKAYVGVPDAGAAFGARELLLFGSPTTKVSIWPGGVRSLTLDTAGNVGIGTASPSAALDVRGDIRLGPVGQFRATSSEENLRIVRGVLTAAGGIITGTGFTATHDDVGRYTINFTPPFVGLPTVTATADSDNGTSVWFAQTEGAVNGQAGIRVRGVDALNHDAAFHFIAVGPR